MHKAICLPQQPEVVIWGGFQSLCDPDLLTNGQQLLFNILSFFPAFFPLKLSHKFDSQLKSVAGITGVHMVSQK